MRINELLRSLRSAYDDWSDFLVNPQFVRRNQEVIWSGFEPRILDYPILKSDVTRLVDDGQYTFQIIEDGSIIQIYYLCERNKILKANLAFYNTATFQISDRVPPEIDDSVEDFVTTEAFLWDEPSLNVPVENGPISWLRIDYAPQDARGVLHHDCHLHLNSFPNSRFVVDGLPTPKQFIEFIVSLCYPEYYKTHRLDENWNYTDINKMRSINTPYIQMDGSEVCNHISHFRIPKG